jgi:hypothetical protein
MDKSREGIATWLVLATGLILFLILSVWPGMAMPAIYTTLITPLIAAIVMAIELVRRQKTAAGLMLTLSIGLVIAAAYWGVR